MPPAKACPPAAHRQLPHPLRGGSKEKPAPVRGQGRQEERKRSKFRSPAWALSLWGHGPHVLSLWATTGMDIYQAVPQSMKRKERREGGRGL